MFHVVLKPEVRKRWYNSIHDITNSLSSNSHALKSNSFHRAHKFQVLYFSRTSSPCFYVVITKTCRLPQKFWCKS